jgi:transposase
MEKRDIEQHPEFDPAGVQAALDRLKHHPELEVGFMVMGQSTLPADNMQSAVDAEHALIIAHEVVLDAADSHSLEPMAEAAKTVLAVNTLNVVADAGYSNAQQAANREANGIFPCVPATRTRNPHGDGTFYQANKFRYDPDKHTYVCPGRQDTETKGCTQETQIHHLRCRS